MRKERGFTLIELLIVIAIIAILAAIAIPQYNKYRANAMLSNVQQLTKSIANQAASLATTAGQNPNPNCTDSSDFAVIQSGDYLEAYPWNGTDVGTPMCDKVKAFSEKSSWVASIEVGPNGRVILTNNGIEVVLKGYVAVKSKYKVGTTKYFGCKYENGRLDDYDETYICHIE